MDNASKKSLQIEALKVRMGVVEGTYNAGSGHPGGSLSVADILAYLYFYKMKIDPKNPKWEERDRFVLSKGHAAPALYAVLAEKGYFSGDEIPTLRKVGSRLQGHPDMKNIPGVDMSTGSLGQGISAACGMALSAKHFGDGFQVYCAVGDGECEEGQVWEAAMFAAHKKLDNLTLFVDLNHLQIDGSIEDVNSPSSGMSSRWTGTTSTSSTPPSPRLFPLRASPPPSSVTPSRARAFPSWRTSAAGTAWPPRRKSTSRLWPSLPHNWPPWKPEHITQNDRARAFPAIGRPVYLISLAGERRSINV